MLDLEKYICKIANENDKVIGTGFFVLPDGYIVTCNHVVKGLKGNVKVGISSESEPIKGEIVRDYEKEDISVIKINRERCPFLLLSTESESGGYIFSHGFSIDNSLKDFPKGFPVKSILTLPTTLENGLKIFVLEDTKVNSGLSGAPAVNDKGNVIGIFGMEYKGRALVIPIEYLFGKWNDLKTKHKKLLQEKYQIKPEIDIPTIEKSLRKERKLEGDFFKEEPRWIDFEGGFIVERNEVNEIIKKMKNEKTQLILGAPASGKSIILKNVGYKLARDNKSVHILELKQHSRDEIKLFFENIPKIINENSIIIVDDAHLNFDDCEKLIEDFENEGKGNLIIGSRETEEIRKGYLKDGSEFRDLIEEEKCIRIKAEDVTEEMIRTFLEKKHKEYDFSAERIKIVSDNLEKYKKDLWHLSWALKAYNPEKNTVSKYEICEKIRDSIRKIEVRKGQDKLNAEDIFLPLSIFYRFEIPIERNYLEEQMGIEGNIINQLIGLQEIREKEETHKILSLHHSSIAELFFRTYLRYLDLGRRTKKNILNGKDENEENLKFCLFYQYLTSTDPMNTVDVVISLHRDFSDEKGGLSLLKKLVEQKVIQKSIETGINKEDDLEKIGACVRGIGEANGEVASEIIYSIDIDVLSAKIEKEKDIEKVGKCVRSVAVVNKNRAMELADSISARIEKEEDIGKVGKYVAEISWTNKDLVMKLANSISLRLDKEKDIDKVLRLISVIAKANEELLSELIDSISAEITTEIIYKAPLIDLGSEEVRLKLINRIDIGALSSRIDKEEDIEKTRDFMAYISEIDNEVPLKLLDVVSARLEREEDIGKVGSCVFGICKSFRVTEELKFKLVDSINIDILSSKIDKENDIEKVSSCLLDIAWASKDVALKLVDSINIDILSSKINKEEDIENVGFCLHDIARASVELGLKLADSVSERINKEEDIEKVGLCVSYIASASKEVALKLTESVSEKINKEEDIVKIGSCLKDISVASKEMALKLVESIDRTALFSKINKEEDNRSKIERFISSISIVEFEEEILQQMNPILRRRLFK